MKAAMKIEDFEVLTEEEFFAPHAAVIELKRKRRASSVGRRAFRSYQKSNSWHVADNRISSDTLEDMARAEAKREEADHYRRLVNGELPDARSSGIGTRALTIWRPDYVLTSRIIENITPHIEDGKIQPVSVEQRNGENSFGLIMPEGVYKVEQREYDGTPHLELWAEAYVVDEGYPHGIPSSQIMRVFASNFQQVTTATGDFWVDINRSASSVY